MWFGCIWFLCNLVLKGSAVDQVLEARISNRVQKYITLYLIFINATVSLWLVYVWLILNAKQNHPFYLEQAESEAIIRKSFRYEDYFASPGTKKQANCDGEWFRLTTKSLQNICTTFRQSFIYISEAIGLSVILHYYKDFPCQVLLKYICIVHLWIRRQIKKIMGICFAVQ